MDVASENFRILEERWPALSKRVIAAEPPSSIEWLQVTDTPTLSINGLRIWSAYDPDDEAETQARSIPSESAQAWIYGVGGGDLIRTVLRRRTIETLHVVPLNLGIFRYLLETIDQRDWLAAPRVVVHSASELSTPSLPATAIPPCLQLADRAAADLAQRVQDLLLQPFEQTRQKGSEVRRKAIIDTNYDLIAEDGDVQNLFSSTPGARVMVAAAGPTLLDTLPTLGGMRAEATLIAVDAALRPLLEAGICPDIVISMDDQAANIRRYFEGDLKACEESTLVYFPTTDRAVIERWPGPRVVAYSYDKIFEDLKIEHPKGVLFSGGSIIHPAVDLAIRMGASEIALFGADFGFPGNRIHANEAAPIDTYAASANAGTTTKNGYGDSIRTLHNFIGYRLALEEQIANSPDVVFLNASLDGAAIEGCQMLAGAPGRPSVLWR